MTMTIDEQLAEAFLDNPAEIDLSEATQITDEAAELLSSLWAPESRGGASSGGLL